jgi:SAM-dependent methyltransferase
VNGGDPAQQRRDGIVQLWTDGDYAQLAAWFAPISERLVGELEPAGLQVLDAATGTGNTAIAAARAGAYVDAFDIAEPLLAQARDRAAREGVEVRFITGDLLDVPYPDDAFDLVVSTFGVFAADDPIRAARELVRVCHPGGRIVTTAWADEGVFSTIPQVVKRRCPSVIPESAPVPHRWADPAAVAELFSGYEVTTEVERRHHVFSVPSTPQLFAFLEEVSGPIKRLHAAVEATGGSWGEVRAEVLERWAAVSRPTRDGVDVTGVYGVAHIQRRG